MRDAEKHDAETHDAGAHDDGPGNFIAEIVAQQLADGSLDGRRLTTRFPPEPNGYLHIGHAKSIVTNFGIAAMAPDGVCHLRFDDTNPDVESAEFVEAIQRDIRWLGFDWGDRLFYASDYFGRLYEWAERLVREGKAYVDSQSLDEIRKGRGSFYEQGVESPFRDRSVEENLDLLRRMKAGEFEEGTHVLRARIDMQSPDLKLRDPLLYRIKRVAHHRTGTTWSIYPMYDWAHGQSDAIEGVTHSLCSLEFQNHRPLYDWFLSQLPIAHRPRQIEFARLKLAYTVLSKRWLRALVEGGHVAGWDDPRMPTLAGLRRRGYPPSSIVRFCARVGVARKDNLVDYSLFESTVREDLNATSPRIMAVLRPLKLTIDNYPADAEESFALPYMFDDPSRGSRPVPFCRDLYVERDDFLEDAPKKWWRLAPGKEVRLRGACLVTVKDVVKDEAGEVIELRCTWDPDSRGGDAKDGRKVRGTIHWVSARHAVDATVRLYDQLFLSEDPMDAAGDEGMVSQLNPTSLEVLSGCKVEPSVRTAAPEARFQFERLGYFVVDRDGTPDAPVLDRTIPLKDSWAKVAKKAR